MRLICGTILLMMLSQPLSAGSEPPDSFDPNPQDVRVILAETENEGVAAALAICLNELSSSKDESAADKALNSACYCGLKYKDVKTETGFEALFFECLSFLNSEQSQDAGQSWQMNPTITPQVTMDDISAIQQHIAKCWQPPIGTIGDETLAVDIHVELDDSGYVLKAEIVDDGFAPDARVKASAIGHSGRW